MPDDPNRTPYIQFVHVSKAFDETQVLNDVSFEIGRGEMVVVLGRSGVGKSVTLKHILGFIKPDAGEVLVDGQPVTHKSEVELAEVRRHVTMVFQSGALFDSLTVGENVAYPLQNRADFTGEQKDARVAELAEMLEVTHYLDKVPS